MKRFCLLALILLVFVSVTSAQVKFTTPTCPGIHVSQLNAISNNGVMVGSYYTDTDPQQHPLLISKSKCIPIGQQTILSKKFGIAFGVNDRGAIVGSYYDGGAFTGPVHGFLLNKNGVLTLLVACRRVTITRLLASKLAWPLVAKSFVTQQQHSELSSIAQSRALPAGYVFRAKLILMLAEGVSFSAIKQQLQTTAPTIIRWKQRFRQSGLEGLDTYHPGQKPSVLTPALRARILSATRRKPSDGSTHWSCRKLASALGVSKDAVHRVWQEAGLKPHRLQRYMASDDPEFEVKAADIIGLYWNPPQHAAVILHR